MSTVRIQLRKLAWLAMTAMLALSLLPTVAHALSFAKGDALGLTEICTPQGAQWLDADGKLMDREAPATGAASLEHCPYCSLGASAAGLPPTAPQVQPVAPAATSAPPLFLHAPRTLFAWASAQPRAPPSLS